jgi:hypothetical protein
LYKKDFMTLVEKQQDKWPTNQDGTGLFNAKTPIRIIKNVLLDPKHGFTTNLPRHDASATLSKSKTAASRTLTYQKERAVDQAKRDGTVNTTGSERTGEFVTKSPKSDFSVTLTLIRRS